MNLALTFKDYNGILRIGQFDGGMDAITNRTDDFAVRIELANQSAITHERNSAEAWRYGRPVQDQAPSA
jgi:hypothetical protein